MAADVAALGCHHQRGDKIVDIDEIAVKAGANMLMVDILTAGFPAVRALSKPLAFLGFDIISYSLVFLRAVCCRGGSACVLQDSKAVRLVIS